MKQGWQVECARRGWGGTACLPGAWAAPSRTARRALPALPPFLPALRWPRSPLARAAPPRAAARA